MEVTRTFDLLDHYQQNYPKNDVLASKVKGEWRKYTITEYRQMSDYVSYGLMELGINKGDKIATVSNNRPEWNFMDMGIAQIGAVHVPIYPTIGPEEYKYILNHSEARILLVSDSRLYNKISPLISETKVEHVFTFNEIENARNWMKLVDLGKANIQKYTDELNKRKNNVSKEDLCSVIYTSGTTGVPKGVMLSHINFMSNLLAAHHILPLAPGDKLLSFLPLCHVLERLANYVYQYCGMSIYYAENLDAIVSNLKEIKANGFACVPRVLEKIYDKIIVKGKDLSGIKKRVFFWAVKLGLRYELEGMNGNFYEMKLKLARKLVFKKWQEALGGNIGIIISGGAALQPRLARLFWAAGLPVQEGYGLTETSPIVALNYNYYPKLKFGTVGPVLGNVQVKIDDDGEILVKGPNVMLGYFKEPQLTKDTFDEEGWFHTGDIGVLDDDNVLKITDRKKEMFKISGGKYIAPQVVENILKESIFIEQAMVIGENQKFISALIAPNLHHLHSWAALHKIHFRDNCDLIDNPKVMARYKEEIAMINKKLVHAGQISKFSLVCEEWTPDTGFLSPTLKLRRKYIVEFYKEFIDKMYTQTGGGLMV